MGMSRAAARFVPSLQRYRLAAPKDDLRSIAPVRNAWQPGAGDLEGEGAAEPDEVTEEQSGSTALSGGGWIPFAGAGEACHEEHYGHVSKAKWRVRLRASVGDTLTSTERRATLPPPTLAELVASGLPKEDIYRAIREA